MSDVVRALPARVGPPLAAVSALAAIALVVLGFLFAGESTGASVDSGIRDYLMHLESPWRQIALVIDWTGEPVGFLVVLATLIILFVRLGNPRAALLVVAVPAVAVAFTTGLKPLVGRTINDGFLSFPSGHTATATAFAFVVAFVVIARHKLGAVAGVVLVFVFTVVAAAVMAWAQVVLNAHYPTDTFGGFLTTLAVAPAVARVVDIALDRWADRRRTSTTD